MGDTFLNDLFGAKKGPRTNLLIESHFHKGGLYLNLIPQSASQSVSQKAVLAIAPSHFLWSPTVRLNHPDRL